MIIKFDSKNPLYVIDENGHEVFHWNPNHVEKKMTKEDREFIMNQFKINRQQRGGNVGH